MLEAHETCFIQGKDQMSFFGCPEALAALLQRGDPLQRLPQIMDFESFRAELEQAVYKKVKVLGGAPRWDVLLMFKLLGGAAAVNLSDEQLENLCPLCSLHAAPNETTIAAMLAARRGEGETTTLEQLAADWDSSAPLEGCKTISEFKKRLEEWSVE